jgi:hypothetical protein
MTNDGAAPRSRLASGCAIVLGLLLTVCLAVSLGGAFLVWAWVQSPLLHGSVDYICTCAGVNLNGRFLVGVGWNTNLAGLTPLYGALPQTVCGYFPRPPFLPPYGTRFFQP